MEIIGSKVIALNEHVALVHGRHGLFLVNRHDHYIGVALERNGEYAEIEAQFLHQLIRPGDFIIEAGANIGAHTVGLSKAVGPNGFVFAFEPQPHCYAFLQAQIALNGLTNVLAFMGACGREYGTAWLPDVDYTRTGNFGGVSLSPTINPYVTRAVTVTTLNSLDERAQRPIALLKIDVEGMEEDVLRGADQLIAKHRPILYVENDRLEKSASLIGYILELDYRLWWHLPPLSNQDNFFGNTNNLYPNIVSANMVCVPRESDRNVELWRNEITSPEQPHPFEPHPFEPQPGD